MVAGIKKVLTVVSLVVFVGWVPSSFAQKTDRSVKVLQVTGLTGMKNNTGGKLALEGGNLRFSHGQRKVDLAAASMEDVVTGADSQRVVHGTLGSVGLLAAPYGSGRFLSLFRTKLDTLTVKYRDADGALHGAIFTMPVGKAEEFKKELLALGARTSVAPERAASGDPAAKEQQQ
jgi:hypothetical protein